MDELPSSPDPAPEPAQEPTPAPTQEPVPPPPSTSLMARLLNVFAVPGEVFEEVKASPFRAGNWLVPVLFSALVGILSAIVIFSQPSILQKQREQAEKTCAQLVNAHKMQQADAERMVEWMSSPLVLKIGGGMGAVAASVVRVFWWALALWLLGRWLLKVEFDFLKALEVAGLALMINVLGEIVSLLLTVNLDRLFATPSLALVVPDFDATRKSHLFLGAFNLFAFWQLVVSGIGLAKLANVPFVRAALVLFPFWVLQMSLFILIGLGPFAL